VVFRLIAVLAEIIRNTRRPSGLPLSRITIPSIAGRLRPQRIVMPVTVSSAHTR